MIITDKIKQEMEQYEITLEDLEFFITERIENVEKPEKYNFPILDPKYCSDEVCTKCGRNKATKIAFTVSYREIPGGHGDNLCWGGKDCW